MKPIMTLIPLQEEETTMTSRSSIRLLAVCLLALASWYLLLAQPVSPPTGSNQKPKPRMVLYSDISERVEIIGKSGRPLWQLVTVRGKWTAPGRAKPGEPIVFAVNQVNGRPLDVPARFEEVEPVSYRAGRFAPPDPSAKPGEEESVLEKGDAEFTKKTVGEEWELRGVETGGFVGFPDEVWEEVGQPPMQILGQGFVTRFCYVKAKRVPGSKPTGSQKE